MLITRLCRASHPRRHTSGRFSPLHEDQILSLTPATRLVITSDAFSSKMQPARHRMVYALLRDEMAQEGGIHALQLRTLTPEEEERQQKKKEAEAEAKADSAPITE